MTGTKSTLTLTDWRGNKVTREVTVGLDIRDFRGTPGFALLVLAANTDLSIDVLRRWLALEGVGRSRSWIDRRRWLFRKPGPANRPGAKADADRQGARAVSIMRENPTLSLREVVRVLKENGITRSKDWVRQHR